MPTKPCELCDGEGYLDRPTNQEFPDTPPVPAEQIVCPVCNGAGEVPDKPEK